MCGRNALFLDEDDLLDRFDAVLAPGVEYEPQYNIAPGADIEVITNEAPEQIDQLQWGLVPHWADEPGNGHINARAETVATKPSFRDAWEHRPCLVLSSGFYEWGDPNGATTQPYRVHREDGAFAMAGLWERRESGGESQRTVTILTTEPNDILEPIHDRMPVVLGPDEERTWLQADPPTRADMCRPYPGEDLEAYPISTAVNDPMNDGPSVIEPLELSQSGLDSFM